MRKPGPTHFFEVVLPREEALQRDADHARKKQDGRQVPHHGGDHQRDRHEELLREGGEKHQKGDQHARHQLHAEQEKQGKPAPRVIAAGGLDFHPLSPRYR